MKSKYKQITYRGVVLTIPAVSTPTTDLSTTQTLKHPVEKALEKDDIEEAARLLRVLAFTAIRECAATTIHHSEQDAIHILQTTVALSARVPRGYYAIDDNMRCVINDEQGKELDWDCDGRALTNNYYY
jgi:hypothetical protein